MAYFVSFGESFVISGICIFLKLSLLYTEKLLYVSSLCVPGRFKILLSDSLFILELVLPPRNGLAPPPALANHDNLSIECLL